MNTIQDKANYIAEGLANIEDKINTKGQKYEDLLKKIIQVLDYDILVEFINLRDEINELTYKYKRDKETLERLEKEINRY